jgi:hypothetical protein
MISSRRPAPGLALAAALAAALLAFTAFTPYPARAQGSLPVLLRVDPPAPCPQDSVNLLAVVGCEECVSIDSVRVTAGAGAIVWITIADPAACRMLPCTPRTVAWPLGRFALGSYRLDAQVRAFRMTDSMNVPIPEVEYRRVEFGVVPECAGPGLLPHVTSVRIGDWPVDSVPPVVCARLPFTVRIAGALPDGCWRYDGMSIDEADTAWTVSVRAYRSASNVCPLFAPAFADSVVFPGGTLPGHHDLLVREVVRDDRYQATDTFARVLPFVSRPCVVPVPVVCVWPWLDPSPAPVPSPQGCDASVAPGDSVAVRFMLQGSTVRLAGLQGVISAGPHLRLLGADPIGVASGMHLITKPTDFGGLDFLLYSEVGAPIPAGGQREILSVRVRADSSAKSVPSDYVAVSIVAGSDSLGNRIEPCPIMSLRFVAANVCFVRAASCDANVDGRTDVSDLVRMVFCMLHPETCPDTLAARPDCDGDGVISLADVMCCARVILGGAGVGTRDATQLHVSFGAPEEQGARLSLPLVVRGAREMNGALLRVRYPADRLRLVTPGAAAMGSSPWLSLQEPGAGDVVVGVLRLDDAAPDEVRVPLTFERVPGQPLGGEVRVDQGSIVAPDGATLRVDLSGTFASLPGGSTGTVERIELLPARPNPSSGTTRFVVRLPRAADVDLALFDLAGRRVATLWHGAMGAGERAIDWPAVDVHSGFYVARLAVDGTVCTTRVTLRRGR